jgi:hypothetical protein
MQAQACEARRYQNLTDNDDTLVPAVGEVVMRLLIFFRSEI